MSRKTKLSAEEKERIICKYKDGGNSLRGGAAEAGVGKATLQRWIHQYETEGAKAFLPDRRNRVYRPELKQRAVQEYLSGGGSLQEVSKKHGLWGEKQLRDWIKVYNAHGDFNSVRFSGRGSHMKQGRETTQEERIQIVRDCLASGKNYGEMAMKYKVSYQQVRAWTLRFEEMGEAGLEDRLGKRKKDQVPRTELEKAQIEIEQLKHKLYLAEMERDLLKNWTKSRGERPIGGKTATCLCGDPGSTRRKGVSD